MSRVCCVQGCLSVDSDDVTYFPFPVAPRQRRLWREAVRLPRGGRTRQPSPVVCSRHFAPDCTEMARGKLRLKPHSTPHLFPDGIPHSNDSGTKDDSESQEGEEKDEEPNTNNGKRKKKNNKKSRKKKKRDKSDPAHKENEENISNSSKNQPDLQKTDKVTQKDNEEEVTSDIEVQSNVRSDIAEYGSENSVDGNYNELESDSVNQESGKTDSVIPASKKDSELVQGIDNRSNKAETVEFTPDIEAFFMDKDNLDGNSDTERCTIECVPEVVLGCEEIESESELPKDDIEDIISNYHIQSNKKLAARLIDAQRKEDQQNSSQSKQSGTSEPSKPSQTAGTCKNQTETRQNRDNTQTSKQGTSITSNDDEEVEFISSETLQTNYIEVPVQYDRNSKERSPMNDCVMLLEDVQVSIDPATLFLEDAADRDRSDSSVQIEDVEPADPISLVTSSDESDVIIQEPHIDTVEVSDEDEDDIPLMQLVHIDRSATLSPREAKKLRGIFWLNGQEQYYCYRCNYSTMSHQEYETHRANHSRVIQMCELCMYSTASVTQFIKHKKKHKDEKRFKCHLCEYKAKHKMSLVYHMMSHASDSVANIRTVDWNCDSSDRSVNRSVKSGVYRKPKRCGRCKCRVRSEAEMVRHSRVCKGKSKKHSCTKCEYETDRRSDLRRHTQRRHKDDVDELDDDDYVP